MKDVHVEPLGSSDVPEGTLDKSEDILKALGKITNRDAAHALAMAVAKFSVVEADYDKDVAVDHFVTQFVPLVLGYIMGLERRQLQ